MQNSDFPVLLVSVRDDENHNFCGLQMHWEEGSTERSIAALRLVLVDSGLLQAHPGLRMSLHAGVRNVVDAAQLPANTKLEYVSAISPLPKLTGTGSSSPNVLVVKLLSQITNDADTRDIEDTLKRDPKLSVQLLKLVNSVSFSLKEPVTSFGQAINILGRRQLQRWLQILMFAGQKDAPGGSILMVRAALRGALMEQLVKLGGGNSADQDMAFMTGMFSYLEILMGQPLVEVLSPLNLPDEISGAVLSHQGKLGALLNLVSVSDSQNVDEVKSRLATMSIQSFIWAQAQINAIQWALCIERGA